MAKKKYRGSKVKTLVGDLTYTNITGEGLDVSQEGEDPSYKYIAVMETKKDSELHKHMQAQIDAEWVRYCEEFGVKGKPGKNKHGVPMTGIAPKMVQDNNDIDEDTGEGRWVETDTVKITFKTNTSWPDGKPVLIKVYNGKGEDITEALKTSGKTIGKGSTGIIHGTAVGNNTGGAHKVTLYLSAVQLAKFVPYDGSNIETEEIEGAEDIDLDTPSAIPTEDPQVEI